MTRVIRGGDQTYALQVGLHLLFHLAIVAQQGEQKGEPESEEEDPLTVANEIADEAVIFAKCSEERQAMLARLLGKVLESGLSQFHAGLQRIEVLEPGKVFDGHGAMDEVEWPTGGFEV